MGTRQLKALLRVLSDAGVSSYAAGDLKLTFRDPSPQDATGAMAVNGETGAPLDLPEETWDPSRRLAEIYRKHGKANPS